MGNICCSDAATCDDPASGGDLVCTSARDCAGGEAVFKLVYLVLRSQQGKWNKSKRSKAWATVRVQLNILFKERFPIEL